MDPALQIASHYRMARLLLDHGDLLAAAATALDDLDRPFDSEEDGRPQAIAGDQDPTNPTANTTAATGAPTSTPPSEPQLVHHVLRHLEKALLLAQSSPDLLDWKFRVLDVQAHIFLTALGSTHSLQAKNILQAAIKEVDG